MKKGKVYLTENPFFIPELEDGKSLSIIASGFNPLQIENNKNISLSEFAKNPYQELKEVRNLIFIGNSRIINPANRIDPVFEVIHNNTPDLNKIIIDNNLFVSEPWRIIFAFITVNYPFSGFSYSYIAQSAYNKYIEGLSNFNPFSIENILKESKGVIFSDSKACFPEIHFVEIKTSVKEKQEYKKEKEILFTKESSISRIINGLQKKADIICSERNVPSMNILFLKKQNKIIHTDLPIDLYLVSEIKKITTYCNKIYEGLYNDSIL